jgi:hypothetical protein
MPIGSSRNILGAAAVLGLVAIACNSVLGIAPANLASLAEDAGSAFSALDTCSSYCSDMSISCPEAPNQEYISPELPDANVCTTICGDLTLQYDEAKQGSPVNLGSGMPTDNQISCRIWHAHVAGTFPEDSGTREAHCSHAGPLGATMCGQNPCDVFCYLAVTICNNDRPGATAYSNRQECLDACEADGGYPGYRYDTTGPLPDLDRQGSNTLNCRMYHLENYLATGNPVHCSHVAQDGGGVCVDSTP